jgi:hypothetical protein
MNQSYNINNDILYSIYSTCSKELDKVYCDRDRRLLKLKCLLKFRLITKSFKNYLYHFDKYDYKKTVDNKDDGIALLAISNNIKAKYIAKTDDNISNLTNITSLDLTCDNINIKGIKYLTNLKTLNLFEPTAKKYSKFFDIISSSNISNNQHITDEDIKNLVNLKKLNLDNGSNITNNSLNCLRELKVLSLPNCTKITDISITKLTNLTYLLIKDDHRITDNGLSVLTNLETLIFDDCNEIGSVYIQNKRINFVTSKSVCCLTNLTSLYIDGRGVIVTEDMIAKLPKLKYYAFGSDAHFSFNMSRELNKRNINVGHRYHEWN